MSPDLTDLFGAHYQTVLADPPWAYDSPRAVVGTGGRGAMGGEAHRLVQVDVSRQYATLAIEEISALPVRRIVADNAHLYLWITNPMLLDHRHPAYTVCKAWGFEPKCLLTWAKHRHGEPTAPSRKTGYYYRSASEHVVFAVRGKLRLQTREALPTWFAAPRLAHSVKPEAPFIPMVEQASPGPRVELFARRKREGWDVWGNEVQP